MEGEGEGGEGKAFVGGMHPDPEDVKREKEVWKNATRNPLKLQELIEQEQGAGGQRAREADGGGRPEERLAGAAVRRVSRFNLLNPQ